MPLLELLRKWSVDFDAPRYLLLVGLLPCIWFIGRRSLSALGGWRQRAAICLRLVIAVLFICALAEPNWQTIIHRVSVMFVVDASDSVRREELDQALKYVTVAAAQRDAARGDRAGVVVFGRSAAVEVPPIEHPWQVARVESLVDPKFTDLESALKLAEATLPADSGRRVVIVSDGNENLGYARPQATRMQAAGIGFDAVPISYERTGEVAVEKVVVPTEVRRGTPFTLTVVLDNLSDHEVTGKIHIDRELGGAKQLVAEDALALAPGKQALTLRQELNESGMTTYSARFVPEHPGNDTHAANNHATAFSRVTGNGRVLVIEEATQAGRFDTFVRLLRENEIDVAVRDSNRPFDNLADLQEFDCVILADVGRVAGEGDGDLTQFSDDQIHQLVQNTEHFGCGLVVLGGPNSYGAGGWANTELEKALPVDFRIENAKVNAVGALMLVIDSSGSMGGEKIAWSKAAAIAATQMLGPRDFIGVVTFDSEAHWLVPIQRTSARERIKARIDRLGAAGGTDMMPALEEAYRAIQGVDAAMKHVVALTDGQTPKKNFAALVSSMQKRGITTTGVAVGQDADRMLLADIGRRGGGKFYHVLSPNAIPKIFMREARRVAMPLVFEDANGIPTQIVSPTDVLTGITGPVPPVTGYVLTTVKDSSLVEVLMATPRQPQPNSTILATWQFGLGRAVALTTDIGQRWATEWKAWGNYDKLMLQTIRWATRSHDASERFVMTTEARDSAIQVVVTAIDPDDASLSALQLGGSVVLPDGTSQEFELNPSAPGRYVASLPAGDPGNYYVAVAGAALTAPLRSAVHVSAAAELARLVSYDGLLAEIVEGAPQGGERGLLIRAPGGLADTQGLLATNVFRRGVAPAKSRHPIWPLLLVAASVLFLADVCCRRVILSLEWVRPLMDRVLHGRGAVASDTSHIERLRKSKLNATSQYASSAGAARFELDTEDVVAEAVMMPQRVAPIPIDQATPVMETTLGGEEAAPEFTSRLLEAKRRVRDNNSAGRDGRSK